ncbi:MAG: hypothetical protein LVQ75_03575 [Candidatus Babeliales bacterium]|jgi:hypothetical protein
MLNAANSCYLLLLSLSTFCILLLIRQRFIQQKKYIFLFHTGLFIVALISIWVGGGVLNDAYQRFETFTELEETGQLETARAHPESYDSMLQIDFIAFKNSTEFKKYLKKSDAFIDQAVAIGLGWLVVLFSEVILLLIKLITAIKRRKKGSFSKR